jgi:hypothetical protein
MFATRARRIVAATALTAAATGSLLALAPAANADPVNAKNNTEVTVSCANGHSYSTVANGNGRFTPAHDMGSTATLIPLAFSNQLFTITDPNGMIIDQETAPDEAKGNSASAANRASRTTCNFSGSQIDPVSGNTFTFSGTVIGFVTPAN